VPDEAFDLLAYALARQTPRTIILERDERLEAGDEILADLARIRACVALCSNETYGQAAVG
jgi:uncharacterized protein (UPF0276 family)